MTNSVTVININWNKNEHSCQIENTGHGDLIACGQKHVF